MTKALGQSIALSKIHVPQTCGCAMIAALWDCPGATRPTRERITSRNTPDPCISSSAAAGSARRCHISGSVKRVASAVGDGSIVVQFIHRASTENNAARLWPGLQWRGSELTAPQCEAIIRMGLSGGVFMSIDPADRPN